MAFSKAVLGCAVRGAGLVDVQAQHTLPFHGSSYQSQPATDATYPQRLFLHTKQPAPTVTQLPLLPPAHQTTHHGCTQKHQSQINQDIPTRTTNNTHLHPSAPHPSPSYQVHTTSSYRLHTKLILLIPKQTYPPASISASSISSLVASSPSSTTGARSPHPDPRSR